MPWVIDIDHVGEPDQPPKTNRNAAGLVGPSGYTGDGSELTHRFRLRDDDKDVHYEGRSHDNNSFGPLDNFGGPNSGCTELQYWEDGRWQTL